MRYLRDLLLICTLLIVAPLSIAADSASQSGVVSETMEAGGYVYIKLEKQGIWLAANKFAVSKGDSIRYTPGAEMRDFYSKSLDRTFESIFFVQAAFVVNKDEEQIAAAVKQKTPAGKTMKPAPVSAPVAGEISPLKDGKTIADVYAQSASLSGQNVKVNARVMKVSRNILGKNWITVQDGTGTEPDNKLVVTSADSPFRGDLIVVTGTLATDIDIGSGYKYKVLLEEATFSPGLE